MPKDFTIDDLLRELRRWQQQAKTGGLTFHFLSGTVAEIERPVLRMLCRVGRLRR